MILAVSRIARLIRLAYRWLTFVSCSTLGSRDAVGCHGSGGQKLVEEHNEGQSFTLPVCQVFSGANSRKLTPLPV
jgi:hypothetical protein